MKACILCLANVDHPWHDDGTPNMPDMVVIIDGYTNHLGAAPEQSEDS